MRSHRVVVSHESCPWSPFSHQDTNDGRKDICLDGRKTGQVIFFSYPLYLFPLDRNIGTMYTVMEASKLWASVGESLAEKGDVRHGKEYFRMGA